MRPCFGRRHLLGLLGAGLGGLALSACGGAAAGSASATTSAGTAGGGTASAGVSSVTSSAATVAAGTPSATGTASASRTTAGGGSSTTAATTTTAASASAAIRPVATIGGATTTIRFLERSANKRPVFDAAVPQFERLHPTLQVQVEYSDRYHDKLIAAVAGGTPPDLAFTSDDDLFSLAQKGLLLDLFPYFDRDQLNQGDYFPYALQPQILKGKLYGMPLDFGVWVLMYNKDPFDKGGVPAPDGTWDLTRLQQAAEQLTRDATGHAAPGVDPTAVTQFGLDAGNFQYGLDVPVGDYGGAVLSADASKCRLQEQSATDALQWVADLGAKFHCAPVAGGKTAQPVAFNKGNIAMQLQGSWSIAGMRTAKLAFDWDIAPPPKGPAKQIIQAEASGVSLIKAGKNPDGAWLLNSAMTGPDGQTLAFQFAAASVPSLKAVADKVFASYKDQPASVPILADLAARANSSPYWQRAVSDTELEKVFGAGLAPLWQGKQTAETALASVVPQVDALLASDQQYLKSL